MTSRAAAAFAALLGALAYPASIAAADPAPPSHGDAADLLAAAAAAFSALRYDQALVLADQAWSRGGSDPDQVRRIFALAGQSAAAIGDADAARLWFGRWVYVEPTAALPDGTSPKLTALLGEAREALAGAALTAHATAADGAITVTVGRDPLALVEATGAGAMRVRLRDHTAVVPARAGIGDLELVDRHGNTLAVLAVPPALSGEALRGSRPWFARWTSWAIAGGGLAAIGGGALWIAIDARSARRALDRESDRHDYSEARALDQRLERAGLVADVAIAGASVAVLASTVLWLRDRGEPTIRVSARVSAAGASVAWSVRF